MKKCLTITAIALCLAGLAAALENTPAEPDAVVEQIQTPSLCPAVEQAEAALSTPVELGQLPWLFKSFGYPPCSSVHGTYCSPPGSTRHCMLAPYEPEICVCQNDNTWKCYWW